MFRYSRRTRSFTHACAVVSAVLLLLISSVVIYTRRPQISSQNSFLNATSLHTDVIPDFSTEDHIDEIDIIEEEPSSPDELDPDRSSRVSRFLFDHVTGVLRRPFDRKNIHNWDEYARLDGTSHLVNPAKSIFGSDDVAVDESVRERVFKVSGVEDALLLKSDGQSNPLRDGWGVWFDKKGDFLRRNQMFRSNVELLNPLNHPMLQDPDGIGSGLTRGDKLVQKMLAREFKTVPFVVKRAERMTLDESSSSDLLADGTRWGYFPGVGMKLSFSNFMDAFFRKGNCQIRVFLVWNSPSWMYTIRYQRGLESILFHHPDACVVLFSEMIELDFLKDFVKDGYKVAVAMPNLDELLNDTPAKVFSSFWFEWRQTKLYATHYSELIRLAALYKYGGIYLDTDIILLKPLPSLVNSVGREDEHAGAYLNGAVMVFRKHSPFIMECLKEFRSTYEDTQLRWNGAELLTRVGRHFLGDSISNKHVELKVLPSFVFFPVDRNNITRYFFAPATESERAQQDALFKTILNESVTFHFWNSITSVFAPETESLVAKLIDHTCIHCSGVL